MITYICDKCGCDIQASDLWSVNVTAGDSNPANYLSGNLTDREYQACSMCIETLMRKEGTTTQ